MTTSSRWLKQFYRAEFWLAAILLLGAGLRFHGLYWDAPYFFNPDEKRLINWGMEINYLDPGISEWGTLPLLTVKLIESGLSIFFDVTETEIYIIARGLSAFLGTVSIFLVYRLALKMYDHRAALYAALFTTFTVLHIQYAHFYSFDNIFAFLVLLAFFPILNIIRTGDHKDYLLAGLVIGLAVAVRLNGWFLLAPLAVAHGCHSFRSEASRQRDRSGRSWPWSAFRPVKLIFNPKLWSAFFLSGLIFILLTPAVVLNPAKYLFQDGLVWILLQTQGYLKSQYTLQFEGTGPWFFVSNLMFWAAGPFLLVAYLAGTVYSVFNRRRVESLVLWTFIGLYCWAAADSRVKFIRYVLPVLPLLNIITGGFFGAAQTFVTNRLPLLRWLVAGWLGLTLVGSGLYALAFVNIYTRPDVRIEAARWIQEHIPPGSIIVHENDVTYAPPLGYYDEAQAKFHFVEINFNHLYESGPLRREWRLPPWLASIDSKISRRGSSEVPATAEVTTLTDQQKKEYFQDRLRCADYIILSDRHYSVYRDQAELFPVEAAYYAGLFDGRWSFEPIQIFRRKPGLLGWQIDDSPAELTFRIFDHPTIWIFQAQLPKAYLDREPPQTQVVTNWSDRIKLVGYNIDKTAARPGETIQLTLYWESLAEMQRDYTIFLQLQNEANQIVAQNDHQVADNLMPTSCWQAGRIIQDRNQLLIPPDARPGHYRLKLGLYYFETLERLPIVGDASGENAFALTDIEILK